MLRLGIGIILMAFAQGFAARGAMAELHLPSLAVGGKVYSNVVVTPTTKNRILLQHSSGMATLDAADLTPQARQELAAAGMIVAETGAKDSAIRPPQGQTSLPTDNPGEAPPQAARERRAIDGSFASLVGSRFESEAQARGGISAPRLVSMIGLGLIVVILSLIVGLYFLRCWCLFRIVRKATGEGSLLVFLPLPLLRWLPLVDAARLARAWLWVPTFALVGLFLPPPLPGVPAAMIAYWSIVAGLWLATAILFVVQCFKLCQQLECNLVFGFLLILPLLDWIALLYMAFSEDKGEAKAPAKGIVFAV